jgi:type III pantothenate kinase
MKLVIDAGNSNIKIALFKDIELLYLYRYESHLEQPQSFYERGIQDLFLEWNLSATDVESIVLSSVVPALTERLTHAMEFVFGKEVHVLNVQSFENLDMNVPSPYEIGSDLVANAYCALRYHKANAIVIDFGTALTFTVANKTKGIIGVTIAPGMVTAVNSLFSATAQLPEVNLKSPKSAIGTNTEHAIQAGICFGYVGLIKEIVERIRLELDDEYSTIATGGMVSCITEIAELFDIVDPNLTLKGIYLIDKQLANYSTQ